MKAPLETKEAPLEPKEPLKFYPFIGKGKKEGVEDLSTSP